MKGAAKHDAGAAGREAMRRMMMDGPAEPVENKGGIMLRIELSPDDEPWQKRMGELRRKA